MRRRIGLNENWTFTGPKGMEKVNVPHTWNNLDGQDGGNDYYRGTCSYDRIFEKPDFNPEKEEVYLEFQGVNASGTVLVNGKEAAKHDGGYSTWRVNITDYLQEQNTLHLDVDNSRNERVYPQKADFTFYGGIYRDVDLLIVSKSRFDLDYFGGPGFSATPTVEGQDGKLMVESYLKGEYDQISMALTDGEGKAVKDENGRSSRSMKVTTGNPEKSSASADNGKKAVTDKNPVFTIRIPHVHLWDGVKDPYLYQVTLTLFNKGEALDRVSATIGFRYFSYDAKKGFFLNGRSYPLRGVCRHQDRRDMGNAITNDLHQEDIDMIKEIGANTIRLAHYQHHQYFYDQCDRNGFIVWAEIPYISSHMNSGRENTISQATELVIQNYHHPSIVCWGVSNEITIQTKDKKDMMDNHRVINDLYHNLDKTRFTTLACYAMCGPFNPVAHITDVVSWNLYLGWYVPGLFLNDLWTGFFHLVYPNRCLGYSEYGAEAMPNLHTSSPRRGDQTEEYQAIYHEYMLKFFERRPWMWATHVWNMFDFAADARDQGGEPGMNHKGLVTFDRKIKKDSFYIYKAYWSDEPFVHICSKRYVDRPESTIEVKVYSNQPEVTLYCDGKKIATQKGSEIFRFKLPITGTHEVTAISGNLADIATFRKVDKPNPDYKLKGKSSNSANWV